MATATKEKPANGELKAEVIAALRAELLPQMFTELQKQAGEIRKTLPRAVFDGDDALFLAWMAGYVAGAHSHGAHTDKHSLEIFARARTMVDKLAPIAQPMGGS